MSTCGRVVDRKHHKQDKAHSSSFAWLTWSSLEPNKAPHHGLGEKSCSLVLFCLSSFSASVLQKQVLRPSCTCHLCQAHAQFFLPDLCSEFFKSDEGFRSKVLFISASGDASDPSNLTLSALVNW